MVQKPSALSAAQIHNDRVFAEKTWQDQIIKESDQGLIPNSRSKDIIALGYDNGSSWPNFANCNEANWVAINSFKNVEMWDDQGNGETFDKGVFEVKDQEVFDF